MRHHLKECYTGLLAAMWAACYFSLICQEVWMSEFCSTWRAQIPESCHAEELFPPSSSLLAGILVWRQMGRDGEMEIHSSSGSLKAKTLVRLKEGRISNFFPQDYLREKFAALGNTSLMHPEDTCSLSSTLPSLLQQKPPFARLWSHEPSTLPVLWKVPWLFTETLSSTIFPKKANSHENIKNILKTYTWKLY